MTATAAADEPGRSRAAATQRRTARTAWPLWPVFAVLIVGLLVTGVLTWISAEQYTRNEKRLLDLRAKDVATVLTAAVPSIPTPLASATALADATNGNAAKFSHFVAAYVGQGKGRQFDSVSLWRVGTGESRLVSVVGSTPVIGASPPRAAAFFKQALASSKLTVIGFLAKPPLRLGYADTGVTPGRFVVYGEAALPSDRYTPPQRTSAFTDINYAIYLGRSTNRAQLLLASVRHLPLNGRRTTVHVPFGETSLAITVAARGPLGGSLPQRLPWIIAIAGVVLTLAAAALTLRLLERRRHSEGLAVRLAAAAEESRRLYAEQRGIAQTLQHALLPEHLPEVPGLEVSARFEAGVEGVEIGGDWYDLIELPDRRLLLVVGDVSGRGLRAAATMASLRFALKAYAAQGDPPEILLSKLSDLLSVRVDGQLATLLLAVVDPEAHQVSVTSAGHLPPLLLGGQEAEFIEAPVGLPVGVERKPSYSSTAVRVPPGATLLAFTDGLVERRGESIETGLERLRTLASSNHVPLDQLLSRVIRDLPGQAADDTAIAGIRWVN